MFSKQKECYNVLVNITPKPDRERSSLNLPTVERNLQWWVEYQYILYINKNCYWVKNCTKSKNWPYTGVCIQPLHGNVDLTLNTARGVGGAYLIEHILFYLMLSHK